ncbi:hypothetical protein ACFV20_23445 [Streptomyces sp. NPDC059696]|uniref:hypothetical protein n=1 Tax=Streptomyces sp. NPDC059696 TaxID=3346911 RepID=UPI0036C7EC3A
MAAADTPQHEPSPPAARTSPRSAAGLPVWACPWRPGSDGRKQERHTDWTTGTPPLSPCGTDDCRAGSL